MVTQGLYHQFLVFVSPRSGQRVLDHGSYISYNRSCDGYVKVCTGCWTNQVKIKMADLLSTSSTHSS